VSRVRKVSRVFLVHEVFKDHLVLSAQWDQLESAAFKVMKVKWDRKVSLDCKVS